MAYFDGPADAEKLIGLVTKVDYEGGLCEYLFGYGGEVPDEIYGEAQDAIQAYKRFEGAFESLLSQHGLSFSDALA